MRDGPDARSVARAALALLALGAALAALALPAWATVQVRRGADRKLGRDAGAADEVVAILARGLWPGFRLRGVDDSSEVARWLRDDAAAREALGSLVLPAPQQGSRPSGGWIAALAATCLAAALAGLGALLAWRGQAHAGAAALLLSAASAALAVCAYVLSREVGVARARCRDVAPALRFMGAASCAAAGATLDYGTLVVRPLGPALLLQALAAAAGLAAAALLLPTPRAGPPPVLPPPPRDLAAIAVARSAQRS